MTTASRPIVLIGFMGAGKSSVGRRLEQCTGLPRFDTDELIAAEFDLPISRIFELHGEEAFRDAETAMLCRFDPHYASIVVTGGGILLRPENGAVLRELGFIVYLKADEETLFRRASKRAVRPLLQGNNPRHTMNRLLQLRRPLYEEYADVTVDTSKLDQDEVTESILQKLPG